MKKLIELRNRGHLKTTHKYPILKPLLVTWIRSGDKMQTEKLVNQKKNLKNSYAPMLKRQSRYEHSNEKKYPDLGNRMENVGRRGTVEVK